MACVSKSTFGDEFVQFRLPSLKTMRDASTSTRLLTLVAASTSFTLAGSNTSTDTPFLSENHQFAIKAIKTV